MVILLLGPKKSLLLDIEHLPLVLQLILRRRQIVTQHLLLDTLPLLAGILQLGALGQVIDVVGPNVRIIGLLPAHGQLIAHTVLKGLWLCVAVKIW